MVVEDDPGTATYFLRVLERADLDASVAGSVPAALGLMDHGEWDLLLVDIGLPGRSGFEFVDDIKVRWPLLPIALTTANATMDVAVKALRTKVDDFLTKPISPDALIDCVHSLLELGRQRSAAGTEPDRAFREELERATQIQQSLLPRSAPTISGYDIAGGCIPVSEVGGDFFDWYLVGSDLHVTIADVMGKGLGAAIVAAEVRAVLRNALRGPGSVADGVAAASATLDSDLEDTSTFVTLFTARLEPATGALAYVDAGHSLSVVIEVGGAFRSMRATDLPLGVQDDGQWTEYVTQLAPGETLICVSDGLLDYFPTLTDALAAACRASHDATSAQDIIDEISALASSQPADDDVTAVVVRRAMT
jgi:sigma-B regulation protein RsbU (phosphoserine phosphatase)